MKFTRILNGSDIHLGNRRLDAEVMTSALWSFIEPLLAKSDLFSMQGDLFDTAISYADPSSPYVLAFAAHLLRYCDEHNIVVRLMRGTFSHDRRQIINLVALHEALKCKNDLKYFDTIALDYIERFDMRILYLPDNLPYESSDAVMRVVAEKMTDLGWDYVDYAYVHGYFDFALPQAAKDVRIVFREDQFPFVKRFINVGHDHSHAMSPTGRTIYNGSMDRLGHGEEEVKGAVYITDDGKTADITFVENPKATLFKTFDYSDLDVMENIQDSFRQELEKLPTDTPVYVRIIHPRTDVRAALGAYLKEAYPLIRYTHSKGSAGKDKEVVDDIVIPEMRHDAEMITEDNLPILISNYLAEKGTSNLQPTDIATILDKLSEE